MLYSPVSSLTLISRLSVCTDGSRVKRMCVAERRQPYSGADWCSGGESDEDDKGFFSKCLKMYIQAGRTSRLRLHDSLTLQLHFPSTSAVL